MHLFLQSPSARPFRTSRPAALRAIFGSVVTAGILSLAAACDKPAPLKGTQTSLATKPNVLFLLFGDKGDPRLLPVAIPSAEAG